MLTRNHRQEALSRAYVQAIAARCGLACNFTRDYDYGVDLTLHELRRHGRRYGETGFRLDIQLKSAIETNATLTNDGVAYDLEARAYANLRDPIVVENRILVLVVLPADETQWTSQTEEHLLIRRCAYWLSLQGSPASMNKQTIRLMIPRVNVFSVEGVNALVDRMRKEKQL